MGETNPDEVSGEDDPPERVRDKLKAPSRSARDPGPDGDEQTCVSTDGKGPIILVLLYLNSA